jgi:predicted naringenin-chalcone synthase
MIVLKATQEKVLRVLHSIAEIVERRHTLPVLKNASLRDTGEVEAGHARSPVATHLAVLRQALITAPRMVGSGKTTLSARLNGFFSSSKANLRNAP